MSRLLIIKINRFGKMLKLLVAFSLLAQVCILTESAVNYNNEPYAAYLAFFGNSGI